MTNRLRTEIQEEEIVEPNDTETDTSSSDAIPQSEGELVDEEIPSESPSETEIEAVPAAEIESVDDGVQEEGIQSEAPPEQEPISFHIKQIRPWKIGYFGKYGKRLFFYVIDVFH